MRQTTQWQKGVQRTPNLAMPLPDNMRIDQAEITRAKPWWAALVGAVLVGAVALPRLGVPALWEPDEGRYAEIAREMLVTNNYLVPRDDFVRYYEKPPLMYWTTAVSLHLVGISETGARLPAALFSAGEAAVTGLLAARMFGFQAAIGAVGVLVLSPLFFGFSRFLTLDPALAFFVTAALGCVYAGLTALRETDPRRAHRRFLGAAAMLGLGTLVKGPVAVVLVGGTVAGFLFWEKRLDALAHVRWPHIIALYCIIALPWFVALGAEDPRFLRFFLLHEHLYRYLRSGEHPWGLVFLPAVLAAGVWPWTPLALRTVLDSRSAGVYCGQQSPLRFLVVWCGWTVLFFSLSASKLGSYVLPAVPPLAILAGIQIARLWNRASEGDRAWVLGIALVSGIAAGVGLVVLAEKVPAAFPREFVRDARIGLVLAMVGSAVTALLSRRSELRPAIIALALTTAGVFAVAVKAREDAAPLNSYRELARAVRPAIARGCRLASYLHDVKALPFYTGAREILVKHRGELAPMADGADGRDSFIDSDAELRTLWQSGQCVIVVVNRRDLRTLTAILGAPPARLVAEEGKKVALINTRLSAIAAEEGSDVPAARALGLAAGE